MSAVESSAERRFTREHLVEHSAETENVRSRIERTALRLLGRHVRRGTEHSVPSIVRVTSPSASISFARPKSSSFAGDPPLGDQDIRGLEVAMKDAAC